MLRVVSVLVCTFAILLVVANLVRENPPVSSNKKNGSVRGDVCSQNRLVLTPYQKRMCEYLAHEFRDNPIMVKVAFCESSLRHQNEHDGSIRVGAKTPDIGVFQINLDAHGEALSRHGLNPYNLRDNVRFAQFLYERQGTRPWRSSRECWENPFVFALR